MHLIAETVHALFNKFELGFLKATSVKPRSLCDNSLPLRLNEIRSEYVDDAIAMVSNWLESEVGWQRACFWSQWDCGEAIPLVVRPAQQP